MSTMADTAQPDLRFNDFVLLQAQNAGLFLGQLPHPSTGQKTVNLQAAQSVIDSLEMMAIKTAENLTQPEKNLLDKAIENLTRLYSEAQALA